MSVEDADNLELASTRSTEHTDDDSTAESEPEVASHSGGGKRTAEGSPGSPSRRQSKMRRRTLVFNASGGPSQRAADPEELSNQLGGIQMDSKGSSKEGRKTRRR